MSMIGKLRELSEAEIVSFQQDPRKCYASILGTRASQVPAAFSPLLEALKQSPTLQKLQVEGGKVRWPTSAADRAELQKEMMGMMEQLKRLQASKKGGLNPLKPHMEEQAGASGSTGELDLHKSWHCLHYLLTGTVEPAGNGALRDTILGGSEIPDVDDVMGYGPARVLTPAQVQSIAAALADFPITSKVQTYDIREADGAGIYVAQHEKEELVERFQELLRFYQQAAAKGKGLLLWLE